MQVEALPKRRLYPVLGFLLALGAPGGLLLFQGLAEGGLGSWDWIREELQTRALTYGYLAVSTTIMFLGLGYIIGSNEALLQRISSTGPLYGRPYRPPLCTSPAAAPSSPLGSEGTSSPSSRPTSRSSRREPSRSASGGASAWRQAGSRALCR